ncbi:transporter, partial [Vibrio sp. 10N.286.49.E1]
LQGGLLVLLLFSIAVSSMSLFVQQLILSHTLKSGKLISSHSSFRFTQSRTKRAVAFSIFSFLIAIVVWAAFRDPYTSQFSRLADPS